MGKQLIISSIFTAVLLVSTANAAISTDFVLLREIDLYGTHYLVWEMKVTTDTDWTRSEMDLTLTSGHMWNDVAFGTDTEPNPAILLPLDMYDPYFADTHAAVPAGWPVVAEFDGPRTLDAANFDAAWYGPTGPGAGTFVVAQITLSADAAGTLSGKSYDVDTEGVGVPFARSIMDGYIVPEPATLAFLAAGAMVVLRKQRH